MRILHVYYRYPIYGGGCYFSDFLEQLGKEGVKSLLIAEKYPPAEMVPVIKNLKILWLPSWAEGRVDEGLFVVSMFRYLFHRDVRRSDIVNCVGPRGLVFALFLKVLYGTKVVCTVEMVIPKGGSPLSGVVHFLYKFLLKNAPIDLVISWSKFYTECFLRPWGLSSKLVTVAPGVKVKRARRSEADRLRKSLSGDADIFLTFVKPLYKPNGDGAIQVIKALKILRDKYGCKVRLILFKRGESQEHEVEKVVRQLGLFQEVVFLPFIKFSEVQSFVLASDYAVLPYMYSATLSRSLLEALALGKVIITTGVGEIKNVLKDEVNGLLTGSSPSEIAEAIWRVKTGEVDSAAISRMATLTARSRFSLVKNVEEQVRLFKLLLAG